MRNLVTEEDLKVGSIFCDDYRVYIVTRVPDSSPDYEAVTLVSLNVKDANEVPGSVHCWKVWFSTGDILLA